MNLVNFKIEEYSDQYKDQIIDHIGNVLVHVGVFPKEALPIDDKDLTMIPEVYFGKSQFWIALVDETLIGTVAIRDIGGGVAVLNRMFVVPHHHGSGVGQQLFDRALLHAKKEGFKKLILNSHELMKRAHSFYERNLFIKVGKKGDSYRYERDL